ncbi:MAG: ParA family protein [Gammaproteobacteria bacterium WSBS_2016_MAG_OTU1]
MKYALWNNKGGVGKTFLSFVLATEYARRNPDAHVVVIDMCPQASISEILLGGNDKGSTTLSDFIEQKKTIGGYFDERIGSPHQKTGNESDKFINVFEFNEQIPQNISLVAGDPSLELQAQTINNIAVQSSPQDSWKNVHSWIANLQEAAHVKHPDRKLVFFIDCNPSFSSYTAQAIVAADRLIIPCTPDVSSARAIRNMWRLVYGYETPKEYEAASFAKKAEQYGISLPTIHLSVLNRSTQYKELPSEAFGAMAEQIKNEVRKIYDTHQEHFSGQEFEDLFADMPDAHTVAVVCSSLGMPVHSLEVGKYELSNGNLTMVNVAPLTRYKEAVDKIVSTID